MGKQRKIIHIDCDCFYASVEMRDDPSLLDQPVAVGGSPTERGVVAACNYAARAFGIHSAMPSSRAMALCPSLVMRHPNMAKYKTVSREIQSIFKEYTPWVEPLSLDEAYLDVSDCSQFQGSATLIAKDIKRQVKNRTGITVSAGVAPNKFLAKIASDWNKPDGLMVIRPEQVATFIAPLPVEKISGVGTKTAEKMHRLGFFTCADLQLWSIARLQQHFGSFGSRLHELCRGSDQRPVKPQRKAKSISAETTFASDLPWNQVLPKAFDPVYQRLLSRLEKKRPDSVVKSVFVKIKFSDFSTTTCAQQHSSTEPEVFRQLTLIAARRKPLSIRLLGMGVNLKENPRSTQTQTDLFQDD